MTACRKGQPAEVQNVHQRWKKSDLRELDYGTVIGARRAGVSISETAVYWDFSTQSSLRFTENDLKISSELLWLMMP